MVCRCGVMQIISTTLGLAFSPKLFNFHNVAYCVIDFSAFMLWTIREETKIDTAR